MNELEQFKMLYEKSKAVNLNLVRVADKDLTVYLIMHGDIVLHKARSVNELGTFILGYATASIVAYSKLHSIELQSLIEQTEK